MTQSSAKCRPTASNVMREGAEPVKIRTLAWILVALSQLLVAVPVAARMIDTRTVICTDQAREVISEYLAVVDTTAATAGKNIDPSRDRLSLLKLQRTEAGFAASIAVRRSNDAYIVDVLLTGDEDCADLRIQSVKIAPATRAYGGVERTD